jgi:hypothetical protein
MNKVTIELKMIRKDFWVIEVNGENYGWATSVEQALIKMTDYAADIQAGN